MTKGIDGAQPVQPMQSMQPQLPLSQPKAHRRMITRPVAIALDTGSQLRPTTEIATPSPADQLPRPAPYPLAGLLTDAMLMFGVQQRGG